MGSPRQKAMGLEREVKEMSATARMEFSGEEGVEDGVAARMTRLCLVGEVEDDEEGLMSLVMKVKSSS